MDAWQKARKTAARRQRRLMMNNDGDDSFLTREASPQAFWESRCVGLEGSQADAIFFSTGGNFHLHSYDSRVPEVREEFNRLATLLENDPFQELDFNPGIPRALIRQGRDNLQLILDFCHRNQMEAFWSLRMNDFHDNWYPWFFSNLKREHPDWLLFRPEDIGKGRQGLVEPAMNATAMDYGRPEVRDLQYRIIRDVCERYDVDGIELDFLRQPIFFRPTMEGMPVKQEHLEIMTGFITQVRELTERLGKKRGRPILVVCTVPNLPELAKSIGLDLETWLRNDLFDIIVASLEQTPFTGSLGPMVKLQERYDVPVIARLSGLLGSVNYLSGMLDRLDGWAGAAANAWHSGVAGLQTFNQFDPHWKGWHTLGDPAVLATMDKSFALDHCNHRTWDHVIEREGRLPMALSLGKSIKLNLPVGADLAAGAINGKSPFLNLAIKLDRMTFNDTLEFRLNGTLLDTVVACVTEGRSPVACGTFFLRARPAPELIRLGDNAIEALLRNRCATAPGLPEITELCLSVKYR